MNTNDTGSYLKNVSPFIQAGAIFIAIVVFILVSKFFVLIDFLDVKPGAPWMIFTSFMLFYALINSMLSLTTERRNKYWLHSILSYVALGIAGGLLAHFVSGLTMDEAGSYRWILFIFTFCYLLFLSIVRAMKKIVVLAQKQDKRLRGEED